MLPDAAAEHTHTRHMEDDASRAQLLKKKNTTSQQSHLTITLGQTGKGATESHHNQHSVKCKGVFPNITPTKLSQRGSSLPQTLL